MTDDSQSQFYVPARFPRARIGAARIVAIRHRCAPQPRGCRKNTAQGRVLANDQAVAAFLTGTSAAYSLVLLVAGVLAAHGYRRSGSTPLGLLSAALVLMGISVSLTVSGFIALMQQPHGRAIDPGTGQSIITLSVAGKLLQSILTFAGYLLLCAIAVQTAGPADGPAASAWRARG